MPESQKKKRKNRDQSNGHIPFHGKVQIIIYTYLAGFKRNWYEVPDDRQLTQGEEIDTMPNMENYYSCLETFFIILLHPNLFSIEIDTLVTYKSLYWKKIILELADASSLIILFCYGIRSFTCSVQDIRSILQQSSWKDLALL